MAFYRLAGTFPRHDKNFMRRIVGDASGRALWLGSPERPIGAAAYPLRANNTGPGGIHQGGRAYAQI
jgi:hypothetical protein